MSAMFVHGVVHLHIHSLNLKLSALNLSQSSQAQL